MEKDLIIDVNSTEISIALWENHRLAELNKEQNAGTSYSVGDVYLGKVSEKVTSVTYHLKKTSSGVMVLLVLLKMLGEHINTSGKNGDLNLRRTGITLVGSILGDNSLLLFCCHFFHLI